MDLETLIKQSTATLLISNLTSASTATSTVALCELRLLSKSDPSIRPFIASVHSGAALTHLSSALLSTSSLSQENAAATLLNTSISVKHPLVSTPGLLDAISHSLSSHRAAHYSPAAVQSAAATVYSLSLDPSLRPTLGSKRNIVCSLIDIVKTYDTDLKSVKDAVKALFGLALHPPNRKIILELDGGTALFDRVVFESQNNRVGVLEDVTAVIAQVAGFQASPEAFKSVGGIRVLVGLIDLQAGGTRRRVRENAVSGLLKLVEFGGETLVEEIREIGLGFVLEGLKEIIHCGSEKGKIRAEALMNVLQTRLDSCSSTTITFSENGSGFGSSPLLNSCSS
ncbi:hypothetical protein RND81_10G096200 [Saponaria officinalis]|uniref:Uncharacterized protein n=1 Tax=Saponaria officinalis TaxID=3572 RepID=A0AAW1I2H7_SAPOF